MTPLQITSKQFIARVLEHWKKHGSLQAINRIWGKTQQNELEGVPQVRQHGVAQSPRNKG